MTTRTPSTPSLQTRCTVASYASYREAEGAVDELSDRGFPVERVAIVGVGLRSVEEVSGRMTTGRAALTGGEQGLFIGLLLGLLIGVLFSGPAIVWLLLFGMGLGAILGAGIGGISRWLLEGRRDFASVTRMEAERYELQVEDGVAADAERLLSRTAKRPR